MTELEALRGFLNARATDSVRLTLLPFIAFALIRALRAHPECNACYDAERGLLLRSTAVHLGIATHTPEGLMVPVVRNAERPRTYGRSPTPSIGPRRPPGQSAATART